MPPFILLLISRISTKQGWLAARSPRIDTKNMGKAGSKNGRVSQMKWKLQSFLLLLSLKLDMLVVMNQLKRGV